MSEAKDFEKFLKGEWYPGSPSVKSEWRKDFEAYLAGKPTPKVMPVPVKPSKAKTGNRHYTPRGQGITNREYMRRRRAQMKATGFCTDCYKEPSRKGKTTCAWCQKKRSDRESKRYQAKRAA